jgi:hypothetical protein
MRKVIVLNGAPSSGKDTIANFFRERLRFSHQEVKQELFDVALAISGIDRVEWFIRYDDRTFNTKEKPWDKLLGLSQREYLIKISEEWMKPVFGSDIFGKKAGQRIMASSHVGGEFIFSDGGFQDELDAMSREIGTDNILLVRLHRDGCNFKNDSRSHLRHRHEVDITNDGTVQEVCKLILLAYMETIF